MKSIKMKIHEYDEQTHSLIVSFCSDDSVEDIDNCKKIAFNINNYNPDDLQDAIQKIAKHGIEMIKKEQLLQQSQSNLTIKEQAMTHVGKTFEFNTDEINPQEFVIT